MTISNTRAIKHTTSTLPKNINGYQGIVVKTGVEPHTIRRNISTKFVKTSDSKMNTMNVSILDDDFAVAEFMNMELETPYNEQFRNLLKFSMRKSHQIKAFGVFTGEFFQNGTCFAMLTIRYFLQHYYFTTNRIHN